MVSRTPEYQIRRIVFELDWEQGSGSGNFIIRLNTPRGDPRINFPKVYNKDPGILERLVYEFSEGYQKEFKEAQVSVVRSQSYLEATKSS